MVEDSEATEEDLEVTAEDSEVTAEDLVVTAEDSVWEMEEDSEEMEEEEDLEEEMAEVVVGSSSVDSQHSLTTFPGIVIHESSLNKGHIAPIRFYSAYVQNALIAH